MSSSSVWHEIALPSAGLPYVVGGVKRLPDGRIEVKEFDGGDDEILYDARLTDAMRMHMIADRCIRFPKTENPLVYEDLLVADRDVALLVARSNSMTTEYAVKTQCINGNCANVFDAPFDLLKDIVGNVQFMPREAVNSKGIPILDKEGKPTVRNYNADIGIVVTLPKSKHEVTLRLRTVKDEKLIADYAEGRVAEALLRTIKDKFRTLMAISNIKAIRQNGQSNVVPFDFSTIDGVLALSSFYRQLPMIDILFMKDVIDAYGPGVPETIVTTCPKCRTPRYVTFSINSSFFRPALEYRF